MNNIRAHRKLICGYFKQNAIKIIDVLIEIILNYSIIPEHFKHHGRNLTCHENDYTISYMIPPVLIRTETNDSDDILDARRIYAIPPSQAIQTAYGWVEMCRESMDVMWKFQYALPQKSSSRLYIGITNAPRFTDIHPRIAVTMHQENDLYLGFEITPKKIARKFNKFRIEASNRLRYSSLPDNTGCTYAIVDAAEMIYGEGYFRVKSEKIMNLLDFTMSEEFEMEIDYEFHMEATVELVGLSEDWDHPEENSDRLKVHKLCNDRIEMMRFLLSVSVPIGGSFSLKDYNFGNLSQNPLFF